jgi:hypothetical protein
VVGDGNGAVPTISALIAAGGVTHEVWRGQVIQSVTVDPNAANQIDVAVDIPASSGGAEIGPFTVTEFAILDALGNCCIVGTTNLEKTVSSQGQTSDLAWIAAVVVASTSAVTITPPNGGFATMAQVIAGYNANLPDAAAPITRSDTLLANGWLKRIFGIAPATQPGDPVSPASSAAAMGAGRPASAAEYAAGAPTVGGFAWPWPTLQQVAASFAAVTASIAALGASLAGYLLKSGGTMTGPLITARDPQSAMEAANKEYVDGKVAGVAVPSIAGLLPEAGGTMTGPLITARDPQSAMEAANKEYVDGAAAALPGGQLRLGTTIMAIGNGTMGNGGQGPADTLGATISPANGVLTTAEYAGATLDAALAPNSQVWRVVSSVVIQTGVTYTGGAGGPFVYNLWTRFTQLVRVL